MPAAAPLTDEEDVAGPAGGVGTSGPTTHPFLVHAADRHRGTTPRFMSQPPLFWRDRLDLEAAVETAIRIGLGSA
jgi:hypothetical protein